MYPTTTCHSDSTDLRKIMSRSGNKAEESLKLAAEALMRKGEMGRKKNAAATDCPNQKNDTDGVNSQHRIAQNFGEIPANLAENISPAVSDTQDECTGSTDGTVSVSKALGSKKVVFGTAGFVGEDDSDEDRKKPREADDDFVLRASVRRSILKTSVAFSEQKCISRHTQFCCRVWHSELC